MTNRTKQFFILLTASVCGGLAALLLAQLFAQDSPRATAEKARLPKPPEQRRVSPALPASLPLSRAKR